MSLYYYDRQGNPLTLMEWASSTDDKRVAYTKVDDTTISTVWLEFNHQYGDGPPLIFETMVFGGPFNEEQIRYSTEAEAVAGHDQMVALVREAQAS